MCIALLALDAHPGYRLLLAGNRDEFYGRPASPAAFWPEAPQVLAGRDLDAGGTWAGVTTGGRFALVTNVREPGMNREDVPSRGALAARFLRGGEAAAPFARAALAEGSEYNGFNLLVGDRECLVYCSNRAPGPLFLGPGTYGLSNAVLDAPWPKVLQAKSALAETLDLRGEALAERLFAILADRTVFPDEALPSTGLPPEVERTLSPVFTATEAYGTRCSTVILADRAGRVLFLERTFDRSPERWTEVRYEFALEK